MSTIDEISRLKIWNLYVVPKLKSTIERMQMSDKKYAFIDYEVFTDKVGKIKTLRKKASLKQRFILRSKERGEEMYYNCIKDMKVDNKSIIFVMFLYSQFYTFCPSLHRINTKNEECYRPFSLVYDYPYTTNIWFRDEVLIDKFKYIKPELIWYKLKQLGRDEILILENNAAHNDVYFHNMRIEEYVEELKLLLVHQDVIGRVKKMVDTKKKFLIYYVDHYLTYFLLFVFYDTERMTFTPVNI